MFVPCAHLSLWWSAPLMLSWLCAWAAFVVVQTVLLAVDGEAVAAALSGALLIGEKASHCWTEFD